MKERKPMNYWHGTAEELAKCYPASDANEKGGYIRISRNNVIVLMHRWIWEQMEGPIPDGHEIDHINGIRTDNRRVNLRCVPQAVNKRNAKIRIDNTSGVLGVSLWEPVMRGKTRRYWKASAIDMDGKPVSKTFSIPKHGEEMAFQLACEARQQMSEAFGYHPNHGKKLP